VIGRAALVLLCLAPLAAQADSFVTPRAVVYPRQILRADMLELRRSEEGRPVGAFAATSIEEVAGKAARATLLPGRPIARDAVGAPQLVQIGAPVSLVFRGDGLDIRASGVALQAAAAGETIRARNAQTAVIVSGVLAADGSVRVGEGP
jgi:flagella basal body P-ring formation protein FlgA